MPAAGPRRTLTISASPGISGSVFFLKPAITPARDLPALQLSRRMAFPQKMDRYSNYAELAREEILDKDYTIACRPVSRKVAVIAIHGGGIEPGTADIADAVAGKTYSFYAFKGLKRSGNGVLHLSSNRFDEPQGRRICAEAETVLSIHGCRETTAVVLVGGMDGVLKRRVVEALNRDGFPAVISQERGKQGVDPKNICNRCQSGKGVQLEISRGFREMMFDQLERRSIRCKTPVFDAFVSCLHSVLTQSGNTARVGEPAPNRDVDELPGF